MIGFGNDRDVKNAAFSNGITMLSIIVTAASLHLITMLAEKKIVQKPDINKKRYEKMILWYIET